MSIPTSMKFLVRGKSVDFRNREGSRWCVKNGRDSSAGRAED
uniref:Uncharacterized protein n=1 Tax=Medicago truncatula TaxID=3880 RepID=A2Q5A7_MEDTR|nr:hypothetical protein MtrDRAFT_AC160516g53v2 [Medicago truncatula]